MNTNYSAYLTNISYKMNQALEKINRGGFDKDTNTLFNKLKTDNVQHETNINIKGIDAVLEKYQIYQTTFTSVSDLLEQYKNKTIQKINDTNSPEGKTAINAELNGISESINYFLNQKVGDFELFKTTTYMHIGNNMKAVRSFDESFIEYNGKPITDTLNDITNNPNPNLDDIEAVINFIQEKQTIIGVREKGLEATKRYNEHIQRESKNNFEKTSKLEEAIMEMENLSLNYEAMSKAVAKISSLSLVNYI